MHNPNDAEALGIAIIHQDQQLVPSFDVMRNAFLGDEILNSFRMLDKNKMYKLVTNKLKLIQADFDAYRQVSTLTVGQREQVSIVSALLQNPNLLILDEPTASLSNKEIERLFEVVEMLKKSGVTIIYISHHLDEVFQIADNISVLRDSRLKGTLNVKNVTKEMIVSMMIGKDLKEFFPKESIPIKDVLLEVENLQQANCVKGIDFILHRGEILGFAGLIGAGRTEAMMTIYGALKKSGGLIKLDGNEITPKTPSQAKKAGIAYIPEDRRGEGIVSDMSISENLSLVYTKQIASKHIINRRKETNYCSNIINALNIVCASQNQLINELSGGNQQKAVIGKWINDDTKIYIFDQPTTGVDVGAKTEIYKVMMDVAKRGCGVIFISSENDELLGICDRILVMSKGKIVKELSSSDATEEKLLYWSSEGNK
jgi:ribose transport system ATP-binding protein